MEKPDAHVEDSVTPSSHELHAELVRKLSLRKDVSDGYGISAARTQNEMALQSQRKRKGNDAAEGVGENR